MGRTRWALPAITGPAPWTPLARAVPGTDLCAGLLVDGASPGPCMQIVRTHGSSLQSGVFGGVDSRVLDWPTPQQSCLSLPLDMAAYCKPPETNQSSQTLRLLATAQAGSLGVVLEIGAGEIREKRLDISASSLYHLLPSVHHVPALRPAASKARGKVIRRDLILPTSSSREQRLCPAAIFSPRSVRASSKASMFS